MVKFVVMDILILNNQVVIMEALLLLTKAPDLAKNLQLQIMDTKARIKALE